MGKEFMLKGSRAWLVNAWIGVGGSDGARNDECLTNAYT